MTPAGIMYRPPQNIFMSTFIYSDYVIESHEFLNKATLHRPLDCSLFRQGEWEGISDLVSH